MLQREFPPQQCAGVVRNLAQQLLARLLLLIGLDLRSSGRQVGLLGVVRALGQRLFDGPALGFSRCRLTLLIGCFGRFPMFGVRPRFLPLRAGFAVRAFCLGSLRLGGLRPAAGLRGVPSFLAFGRLTGLAIL